MMECWYFKIIAELNAFVQPGGEFVKTSRLVIWEIKSLPLCLFVKS